MQNGLHRQSSLRDKLKSSICCFSGTVHHDPLDHGESYYNYNKLHIPRTPTTPISPGSWLKKSPTSECGDPPRVRGRGLMSRKGRKNHHRQSQSADFSYDPSSYALNFEDQSRADHEEFPFRNFSSRLPASPPTPSSLPSPSSINCSEELPVTVHKEIVGYS